MRPFPAHLNVDEAPTENPPPPPTANWVNRRLNCHLEKGNINTLLISSPFIWSFVTTPLLERGVLGSEEGPRWGGWSVRPLTVDFMSFFRQPALKTGSLLVRLAKLLLHSALVLLLTFIINYLAKVLLLSWVWSVWPFCCFLISGILSPRAATLICSLHAFCPPSWGSFTPIFFQQLPS